MINFWSDLNRFHPLVSVDYNAIHIHKNLRPNTVDSFFSDGKRDPILNKEIYSIKFNDVKINIKIMAKGFKI